MTNKEEESSQTQQHEDTRPLIGELLAEHSEEIRSVQNMLLTADEELYRANSSVYDDIWILRFILSHKKDVKAAGKAALKTMNFRKENKLNELGDTRHILFPVQELFGSFCEGRHSIESWPDENRGIIQYINLSAIDTSSVGSKMSHDDLVSLYMYVNESVYKTLDEVTRRTGRLTKCLRVIDFGKVQLRKLNLSYLKKDAAASKDIEDYYPQLLGMLLVVNSPSWLSMIWNTLRPLFPRRLVEKVDFFGSISDEKSRSKCLKRFTKYISEENLPHRYGGKEEKWPPMGTIEKKRLNR